MRLIVYDCENCYNQEVIDRMADFKGHEIVFVVGRNQKVSIPNKDFITIIRAKEVGHNHADFIAVTEMTRRLHTKKYQSTCMITKDKGFNGAVDLLKEYGFTVNRYSLKDFVIKYIKMFRSLINLPNDEDQENNKKKIVVNKQKGYKPSSVLAKYNITPTTPSEHALIGAVLFVNRINKESKDAKKEMKISKTNLKKRIHGVSKKYQTEVLDLLKLCKIVEDDNISISKENIDALCAEGDKILAAR